ncbi:hypothetical protein BHF69_08700 [Anaerostipes sp. 992a]|uniref:WXG100 family type VII secretion target n=1 Tax=Anaerostipes sp. 992a TaxID=1261637 RepID=UPI0009532863|nr:WXG100 family type VII secretion target [Anaerostipes sp. 992a]OLR62752.1 hypothetical protein BHF69_08700 [Anaerostipes sp. 992a]
MARTIQVTTGTLKNKASELKSLNAKFKTQIENLKTQENALNGMWDGEANDAFHREFMKDITQMHNFYNAIEQYVAKLNEIAASYEKAEKNSINHLAKH